MPEYAIQLPRCIINDGKFTYHMPVFTKKRMLLRHKKRLVVLVVIKSIRGAVGLAPCMYRPRAKIDNGTTIICNKTGQAKQPECKCKKPIFIHQYCNYINKRQKIRFYFKAD